MARSIERFKPFASEYPATNFPQQQLVNRRPVNSYDASTDEAAQWTSVAPQGLTGTLKAIIHAIMASATSGDVIFQADVEAITPGDAVDLDAGDSFDSINSSSAVTVPATAGFEFTVEVTLTNKDSIAAGDYFRLRVNRDANAAGDTAAGDCHVLEVELQDSV